VSPRKKADEASQKTSGLQQQAERKDIFEKKEAIEEPAAAEKAIPPSLKLRDREKRDPMTRGRSKCDQLLNKKEGIKGKQTCDGTV